MLATIITLTIIVGYLTPIGIIQPKLALHNYNNAGTERDRRNASFVAFWQALLWPAMAVMLQGHKAIHEKVETEKAREETRQRIADYQKQQKLEAFAEFDKELGVRSRGVILAKHLKRSDLNRTITLKNRWDEGTETFIMTEFWNQKDSITLKGKDPATDKDVYRTAKPELEIVFN